MSSTSRARGSPPALPSSPITTVSATVLYSLAHLPILPPGSKHMTPMPTTLSSSRLLRPQALVNKRSQRRSHHAAVGVVITPSRHPLGFAVVPRANTRVVPPPQSALHRHIHLQYSPDGHMHIQQHPARDGHSGFISQREHPRPHHRKPTFQYCVEEGQACVEQLRPPPTGSRLRRIA